MERLFGVFDDAESLYDIGRVPAHRDEPDIQLGFSDIAAGPYEALVHGTVDVLAAVPGVLDVWQEDREVVLVRAPGVATAALAEVVDRFWLHSLPRTTPTPSYGELDPPDVSRAWSPPPLPGDVNVPVQRGQSFAEAVRLPPSRRRMWTYLVCGAVATAGGLVITIWGEGSGTVPLVIGVVNLAIGLLIARQRRALAG
ncbi:hypothetical protein [uncultured Cellulomonas sp.]|uniref:hypothetical protein n=1 Tax=uncultured Cellulomonas sp. TaxID=189682 RepID=UPI0028EF9A51|nr:hypothetical protein [uncultured Cellulomonas sp.]